MSDHTEAVVSDHASRRAADRRRAAKLRERRDEAGQVRISAWVPRERAAYARQVLQAAAAGANALPPNPEQQGVLDAARSEVVSVRAELDQARTAAEQAGQFARERAEEAGAAQARAETAERARDEAARELAAAEVLATLARAEAERFQKAPGLRGRAIRWLAQ